MKTLLLLFFCCLGIEPLVAGERAVKATPMQHNSPFAFRENKGQIANKDFVPQPDVLFQAKGKGVTLFLKKDRVVYQYAKITYPKGYQFHSEKDTKKTLDTLYRREQDSLEKQILTESFRMDMVFLNANKNPTILKENKTQDYENYYLAQCPEGATHVYGYTKITYKNLYPNIDWVIYTVDNDSNSMAFKYDFIVHPGGNPKDIQLQYTDIDSIQKLENGDLRIMNPLGVFEDQKPISFQGNSKIGSEFIVKDNIVSFHIDAYDPKQILVIDPLNRLWGTYYGGTSFTKSYGQSCTTDNAGNVYLGGETYLFGAAISYNGHQNVYGGGGWDAYFVKFNSQGIRLWATYYGGIKDEDFIAIKTDLNNNVYICGQSNSSSAIAFNGHQNANTLDPSLAWALFLAKFNSAGIRQWGTYYYASKDGIHANDFLNGLTIDELDNVYISGNTTSATGIAYNGFQNVNNGSWDAFLVKFNPSGVRQWGTYFGGAGGDDFAHCIADQKGHIYLVGSTASVNSIAYNAYQPIFGGYDDIFIAQFDLSGNRIWSTYYGGAYGERALDCATDRSGNLIIAGNVNLLSNLNTFPIPTTNKIRTISLFNGPGFVAKFNPSGTRLWCRYHEDDSASYEGLAVDYQNNIFVSGLLYDQKSVAGGTDAYQAQPNGFSEGLLCQLDSMGNLKMYTYYGGENDDMFNTNSGGRSEYYCAYSPKDSCIYLAGNTSSTTQIAYRGFLNTKSNSFENQYLVKFSYCTHLKDTIDSTICEGQKVYFKNRWIDTSGVFIDSLYRANGCDSIIWLNLTVIKKDSTFISDLACTHLGKVFNNAVLRTSGIYRDTLVNKYGCDSFIFLNLTVLRSDTTYLQREICEGSFHPFNNQNLTQAGIYRDTQTNILGCDSFIILDLKVNPIYAISYQQTICKGNSFLFDGVVRTQAGFYTQSIKTTKGCDSITTMELIVLDTVYFSENKTICAGEVYKGYATTGIHKEYRTAASGCDSVYTLNLTVLNASFNTAFITICKGSSYRGFKDTGIHYLYLSNQYGCDSTVEVHLSFYPPVPSSSKTITICKGEQITINHQFVRTAGLYTETLASVNGCDSLVYITLKVLELSPRLSLRDTSICVDDSLKINAPLGYLMYTWNNGTTLPYLWVSKSGLYSLKVMDTNRCIGYDTVQVARYPIQKLTITAPTEVEKADMFVAKAEGNAYKTLQWKPAALFECDTCAQNKLSLTSTTMLYLYYTDIHQCRYKDSLLIDVALYTADFEFPNAFSPNGDNKNDYFYPEGDYGTRAVFQIYNRWGEKVFESSVAKPRWDGTYKGEPQPAGVYSYYGILTLRSGKTVARKGTVTLIR
jgi:gliding motility-associated-like protein